MSLSWVNPPQKKITVWHVQTVFAPGKIWAGLQNIKVDILMMDISRVTCILARLSLKAFILPIYFTINFMYFKSWGIKMWSASLLEFYKKLIFCNRGSRAAPWIRPLCQISVLGSKRSGRQKDLQHELMVTFLGRLELHSLDLLLSFCFVKDFKQCITCKLITATLIHIAHSLTSI